MDTAMANPVARTVRRERLAAYGRFIKIEHNLFSLPILFAGAFLAAGGWPSWRTALLIVLAGAGARTLAMSLNRIIDKRIDAKNPRTASRELPAGSLSLGDAWLVATAGLLIYLWAARELSDFCLMWSWVPILLFVIYPTLKRFTSFSHFGLGLAWAMAPLGGWFAVRPGFGGSWPAWILAAFSFFWVAGFDIIYATLDEDFDRREGLFSLPAKWGRRTALRVSALAHVLAFACLAALYATSLAGVGAAFLLLAAGGVLLVQHVFAHKVDLAFFQLNVVAGFAVLAMVLAGVAGGF
jgi:4-hydroxybenzoate polyprenyltransferase